MTLETIRSIALVAAALTFTLSPRASASQIFGSDPESLKRTDKLISTAEDSVKQAAGVREEIQKTMDSYNAMFKSEETKVRDAYKNVEKGINATEKKREEAKKQIDAMKTEGDAYFASWKQSLQQITDPDLRKKSEDRMAETRKHFDGVLASVTDARAAYDPFLKSLKDQWTYLGHDLNASGLASLKPDAEKLNGQAGEVFKKIDAGIKKANDYVASLKSTRPRT
jgi:hypothetical protein